MKGRSLGVTVGEYRRDRQTAQEALDTTQMQEFITVFSDPVAWAALASLIVMEVVLGIDNLVFIAILTNKLPEYRRAMARSVGIGLALLLRLALLTVVAWVCPAWALDWR